MVAWRPAGAQACAAAAAISVGVCNSPARALVLHDQVETVQQHQRMADVGPG
jgi:hypothetical protein